MEEEEGT